MNVQLADPAAANEKSISPIDVVLAIAEIVGEHLGCFAFIQTQEGAGWVTLLRGLVSSMGNFMC